MTSAHWIDQSVKGLATQIQRSGYAMVPRYLKPTVLAEMADFARQRVAANGGEYLALTGREPVRDTPFSRLSDWPPFTRLLKDLYTERVGRAAPAQGLYQVLRCLSGETGLPCAYNFHYDSYVVTALLPVIIPQGPNAGDLLMSPNRRPLRPVYLINLVDKIFLHNPVRQQLLKNAADRGAFTKVTMVPGNLYLFWGYCSIHANESADPAQIRCTALYHFGDPHAGSQLRRLTGRAKQR